MLTKLLLTRRFFTFMLLLFLLHSMGLGMFRLIASLCRDETISSTGGAFFFLTLLLLGGFLLPRSASLSRLRLLQWHHDPLQLLLPVGVQLCIGIAMCCTERLTRDVNKVMHAAVMVGPLQTARTRADGCDMSAQPTSIRGGSGSTGSTPCPTRSKVRSSMLSAARVHVLSRHTRVLSSPVRLPAGHTEESDT